MKKPKSTSSLADSIPRDVAEYLRSLPWKPDDIGRCGVLEGAPEWIEAIKLITFRHDIFGSWDETRPGVFSVNTEVLDAFIPGWDLPQHAKENRRPAEKQLLGNGFEAVEHPDADEVTAAKEWLRTVLFKSVSPHSTDVFYRAKAEEGELLQDMLLKVRCVKFKREEHDDGTWTLTIDRNALKETIGEIKASLSKHVSNVTKPSANPGITP